MRTDEIIGMVNQLRDKQHTETGKLIIRLLLTIARRDYSYPTQHKPYWYKHYQKTQGLDFTDDELELLLDILNADYEYLTIQAILNGVASRIWTNEGLPTHSNGAPLLYETVYGASICGECMNEMLDEYTGRSDTVLEGTYYCDCCSKKVIGYYEDDGNT